MEKTNRRRNSGGFEVNLGSFFAENGGLDWIDGLNLAKKKRKWRIEQRMEAQVNFSYSVIKIC